MQDQTLAADEFANYFATVGDRFVENHPWCNFTPEECSRHPSVRAISSKWDSNLFSFRYISAQNMNPNKAVDFDMIPSHVLKIAVRELAGPSYSNFQSMYFRKVLAEFMEEGRVDPSVQRGSPGSRAEQL